MHSTITIFFAALFFLALVVLPFRFSGLFNRFLSFLGRKLIGEADEVIFQSNHSGKGFFRSTLIWSVGCALTFIALVVHNRSVLNNDPA